MPDTPPNLLPSETPSPRESDALRETYRLDAQSQPTINPDSGPRTTKSVPPDPEGKPFGRYILLQEVGRGGMGVVWKAWDKQLQRVVALKQILSGDGSGTLAQASQAVERFTREARLAARLRHPGIVSVYDVGEHEGACYYTCEFVMGRSLDRVMQEAVPVRQAVAWAKEIAEALGAAHQQGVMHRDVKPSNVLIDEGGHARVMDFGLAREVNLGSEAALTMSGEILGTPDYMSPEQARGLHQSIGPASDQFSLGVVLYELVSRKRPFEGEGLRDLFNAIVEKDSVPPSRHNPQVPRDVETVCLKALEKEPANRYASMAELASDLGRCLEGDPIRARPHSFVGNFARKAKKHRAIAIPTTLAFGLALGFAVWFLADHSRKIGRVSYYMRAASASERAAQAATSLDQRRSCYVAERDALTTVLVNNPKNAEARAALLRVDAALAAIDRQQAPPSMDELLRLGNAAKETLRKAGLISQVLARWSQVQGPVEEMERWSTNSRLSPEEVRHHTSEAWPAIQKFMDDTPADPTSQAAMKPLAGWAKRLAGNREEGWAWMEGAARLDPDLPISALMRALCLFSLAVELQPLPSLRSGAGGVEFGPAPGEPADLKPLRTKVTALVDEAERAAVWGQEGAAEYRSAIEGVRAMQRADYPAAEVAFTRAIASPELRDARSAFLIARAKVRYLLRRVKDGLADLDAVLVRRPDQAQVWMDKGLFLDGIAAEKDARLEDPREECRAAIHSLGEAVSRCPQASEAFTLRAYVWRRLGHASDERGDDPREAYANSIADYEVAIGLNPRGTDPLIGCSFVWRRLGEAFASRGQDPHEAYGKAVEYADKAIRLDRNAWDAYQARGLARIQLGEMASAVGQDPKDLYRGAIDDFGAILERNQGSADYFCFRGNAEGHLGEWLMRVNSDPLEVLDKAISDYDQALVRLPGYADAITNRGLVLARKGEWQSTHGADARDTLQQAAASFDKVLAEHPADLPSLVGKGLAFLDLGKAQIAKMDDPTGAFREALQAFDKVLSRYPNNLVGLADRATVNRLLGEARRSHGENSSDSFRAALKDIDHSIQLSPGTMDAYLEKGATLEDMGEIDKAIETYERALRALGGHAPPIEEALARARKAADSQPHR